MNDDVMAAVYGEEAMHVWTLVETEFTCAFPPGLEPDAAVVKAIREFDPDYVPVLCRKVYKTPTNADVAYGYHLIARYVEIPPNDSWKPLKLVGTSRWLNGHPSTSIYEQRSWADEWPAGSQQALEFWPPVFKPFDWSLHAYLKSCHKAYFGELRTIKEQILEGQRAKETAKKKELEFIEEDARHEMKSLVTRLAIRNAVAAENFAPEAPPDPQVYTQAEKVLGAPKAKTAEQGAA